MDTQALIEAAETGATNVVEQLLKSGVDANARPSNGTTALIRAASNNHVETVRVLLDNGANINATRNDGMTPLILAAFFGHAGVAALLLEKGADLSARDQLGSTALQWASSRGHKETLELLKDASSGKVRILPPPNSESFASVIAPVEEESPLALNAEVALEERAPVADAPAENILELDDVTSANISFVPHDEPVKLDEDAADLDETTIITVRDAPRVAPIVPPAHVAAARIAPPAAASRFRVNARLLVIAWLVIFSVSAALSYALTKSKSGEGQTPATPEESQNPSVPTATTQNAQPPAAPAALPPVPSVEESGQPKLTANATQPSSAQVTNGQQPAASDTDARERKSKTRDEATQIIERAGRETSSAETGERPVAPKPTPAPKRDNEDLRARTEAAAPPSRAPAQSSPPPSRNTDSSSETQTSRPANTSSAPASQQQKKKVIRWP